MRETQFLMRETQFLSRHERKLNTIGETVKQSKSLKITHQIIEDDILDGRIITIDGQKLVNFGSCSYMGLETDERLKAGAIEAVTKYGSQFSSSRAYLSVTLYKEIEYLLSQIFGGPVSLAPTTTLCHQANIPVLIGDNDAIILDYQVHESVQNAVRLLNARNIHVEIIRHNNMDVLEERIQLLGRKYSKIWYMADGVYSMLGDLAPMRSLRYLLNKYQQFNLYIDDAHGLSWSGKNGAGYVKSQLWHHDRMILITSLAKSFAACGGVTIYPNENMRDLVKSCGPTLIFSGPIQPPVLGSAIASAKIHLSGEIYVRQEYLQKRIAFFNQKARELELPLINESASPIFFIGLGKPEAGYDMAKKIMDNGFFVCVSVFPCVATAQAGLRIPVTLHHSLEDIENLLNVIAQELPNTLDKFSIDYRMIQRAFKIKGSTTMEASKMTNIK